MRPVILLGRPKGLKKGGWEKGTPANLEREWPEYIQNIATLAGLFLGEGGDVYPEWVEDNMYLLPREWIFDKVTGERRSFEQIVALAREWGKLEERFRWDDDSMNPLRAVVVVFGKLMEADHKRKEEAVRLLVRR